MFRQSAQVTSQQIVASFGYREGDVTATELLSELNTVKGAFRWELTSKKRIRGILKDDAENRTFDPVTAVAFSRTGRFFAEGDWTEAANSLGLLYNDCADLVAACNHDWDPSCRQGILRQALMNTLIPAKAESAFSLGDLLGRGFRKRSATTH